MDTAKAILLGAAILGAAAGGSAVAGETPAPYIQMAEIEIDPAWLDAYKAAVREHIDAAIGAEPGVLVLYAVSEADNPNRIRVFEIYSDIDAYRSHLEAAHFKKYKNVTRDMVTSLKLVRVAPIALGAKERLGRSPIK